MSTLHVENLKGLTSGGNANKIIVPSGQTLTAPGHVIQVVSDAHTSSSRLFTTTSTTFSATGLNVSITPKFNTSKIMIVISSSANNNDVTNGDQVIYSLYRDSTNLGHSTNGFGSIRGTSGTAVRGSLHISYMDSPATTSAVSYELYARTSNSRTNIEIAGSSGTRHSIIAMEIAQ